MTFLVSVSIHGFESNENPLIDIVVLSAIFSFLIPFTLFKLRKLSFQDAIFVYFGGLSGWILLVFVSILANH